MKFLLAIIGVVIAVSLVKSSPIIKRETDDLSPLNEVSGTTDDTPIFDRNKVSLEVPSKAFGTGFTLVTNISKLLGKFILNSAHRTENVLEVFKPFFRGAFAIKGLPSDNEIHKKKRQSTEKNQVK